MKLNPTELNAHIQQILNELIASEQEVGLQVAAYVEGELVVDAWSGCADLATNRPVDGETLFTSWSTTKGFVATCVHLLAERGLLDYDAPVGAYWPEFAAHGKAGATLRHVLIHAAGVPQMPAGVTPEMLTNWDAMCAAIAALPPLWTPGTKVGYHAKTLGWILGEIIRRVDGRPVGQFAREEVCAPLGIPDFYIGIPDDVEPRVAPLIQERQPRPAPDSPKNEIARLAAPPRISTVEVMNSPEVRRAALPASGGIMSARAAARHYALLAEGGTLDGVRLFSPQRIEIMRALQTDQVDEVFRLQNRKSLGYMLGGDPAHGGDIGMGTAGNEFGHAGYGGSLGFADPARRFSFGLTKNLVKSGIDLRPGAAFVVAQAIRDYLDA